MEIHVDRPGRAKRAGNFRDIAGRAAEFAHVAERHRESGRDLPGLYEITMLVWRAGSFLTYIDDDGEERHLNAQHIRLLAILLTYTNNEDWAGGHPAAWPGNLRLGKMLGIDPSYVPRLLRALEWAGCIVREYTVKNRRHGAGGINLAPLFALLPTLRAYLDDLDADLAGQRAVSDGPDRDEYYPRQDGKNSRREYKNEESPESCTRNLSSVDTGEQVRAEGGSPPPKSFHTGRSAPDSASLRDIALQQEWRRDLGNLTHPAIISILTKYSSVFRWNLKKSFGIEDPSKATHAQLLALVRFVKDKNFADLRPGLWSWALEHHGVNAVLAMFYALEAENIQTNRTRFLAGILKKSPQDKTMNPAEGLRRAVEHAARRAREDGQYN
ncbi:MAG: hypothetical protein M0006_15935 [Magnetospirillum sp.]|nr:hypothetical protein [Magnetospirillum sp.]